MEMKLTPRFYQNGERVFGPGVAELLKRVQEHRSLRAAAFSMEMAYSKAWQIIRTAEDGFGCKLLSSTIGGRHGAKLAEMVTSASAAATAAAQC